jgi:hypothetical protein
VYIGKIIELLIYDKSQLPRPSQTSAARVTHLSRRLRATRVFHIVRRAIMQTLASGIFYLDDHAI